MKEEKKGKIAEIIFHNETNFYSILLFETKEEQFFAVGTMAYPKVGRNYELSGEWKVHPKYGEQFAFTLAKELEPTTAEGIAAFLSSGMIAGVGPKMAAAIVSKFGADTLKIIEENPKRLLEVSGIGNAKAKAISEGYAAHKEYANTVLALSVFDISPLVCMKLYKAYGKDAVETVKNNPYSLIDDLYGVGFKKADKIAKSVGIEDNNPKRISSGLLYYLNMRAGEGDSFVYETECCEQVAELLSVSREEVLQGAFDLAMEGSIFKDVLDGRNIYMLSSYYRAEKYCAKKLFELAGSALKAIAVNPENLIKKTEKQIGMQLSEKQRNAVVSSMKNGVLVITGGPGTGKTTIIKAILDIFDAAGLKTSLCAPTGRAAKRMQQASCRPALTVHRLLEYSFAEGNDRMLFARNDENPLDADCIIVDESSMIDILLCEALLRAVKPGTRLIFVGDADQLPPVGAGNVLKDMLSCEYLASCRLTDIFRQAQESAIVVNAHLINKGEYAVCNQKGSDFFFMQRKGDGAILSTILELCRDRLPAFHGFSDPLESIQVLTPTRKGALGSIALGNALQEVLNPPAPDKKEKKFGDRTFRVGDKVMHIKNDYTLEWKNLKTFNTASGVFNGEMGFVVSIDNELGSVGVLYDDDRFVRYDYQQLEELELAYALTVHKSQGSEFPVVVMPMTSFPPMLATRNLLYTAITRAKKGVVLVGNPAILNAMTDNNQAKLRNSGLGIRLADLWKLFES